MDFTTGPAELNEMINRGENINIIDVRKKDDFQTGHIPGAANLPEDEWSSFEGLTPGRVNVIYCYSEVCHLSTSAARFFAGHGFPVMELEGGFEQWNAYNLPVAT